MSVTDEEQLWSKLKAHPHRDLDGDHRELLQVLQRRIDEADRLEQRASYVEQGGSIFERLPLEILAKVVAALEEEAYSAAPLRQYLAISPLFCQAIRAALWKDVSNFPKRSKLPLTRQIAPRIGPLIRSIDCRAKSKEATILIKASGCLEDLCVTAWNEAHLGSFFDEIEEWPAKRLKRFTLKGDKKGFRDFPFLRSSLSNWLALTTVTLVGLRATRAAGVRLTDALLAAEALEKLAIRYHYEVTEEDEDANFASSDEDDTDAVTAAFAPTARFPRLRKVSLHGVDWPSALGLRLLLHCGPAIEEVALTQIGAGQQLPSLFGSVLTLPSTCIVRMEPSYSSLSLSRSLAIAKLAVLDLSHSVSDEGRNFCRDRPGLAPKYASLYDAVREQLCSNINTAVKVLVMQPPSGIWPDVHRALKQLQAAAETRDFEVVAVRWGQTSV